MIEADLDLDFFVCPTHGVLMPGRFDPDWTTDEGCPVLMEGENGCGEHVQPVYLSSLFDLPATPKGQDHD